MAIYSEGGSEGGREGQEGWGWVAEVFVWMVFELNPGFNPTTLLLAGMLKYLSPCLDKSVTDEVSCVLIRVWQKMFLHQTQTDKHYTSANKAITSKRERLLILQNNGEAINNDFFYLRILFWYLVFINSGFLLFSEMFFLLPTVQFWSISELSSGAILAISLTWFPWSSRTVRNVCIYI